MKLWVNLAVERDTCNQICDFRELCNQKGSSYVLKSVIKPTGSTSFELVYYNCGASHCKTIIYLPSYKLKKRRF